MPGLRFELLKLSLSAVISPDWSLVKELLIQFVASAIAPLESITWKLRYLVLPFTQVNVNMTVSPTT